MTFLAPLWLAASGLIAALVVGIHFLARRRPRPFLFPTARFIPDLPASAAAPATRPSDLLILLLRVLAILLLGLALAEPRRTPPRRVAHLVLLDRSQAAPATLGSDVLSALQEADLVIQFDSTARPARAGDWRSSKEEQRARGSLSVALLAALRAAPSLASKGDAVALTIVSPLVENEWDASTLAIRALWPGGVDLLVQDPALERPAATDVIRLPADDPLSATLTLLGDGPLTMARIRREPPAGSDSAWARAGGTLVYWPRDPVAAGWGSRSADTVSGILAGGRAVVAQFVRVAAPPSGSVSARWIDGSPAATERRLGTGCLRSIAVPIPEQGDFAVRPGLVALVRQLVNPCGAPAIQHPATAARLDSLRGGPSPAPARGFMPPASAQVPANPWLLLVAALFLVIEMIIRARRRS